MFVANFTPYSALKMSFYLASSPDMAAPAACSLNLWVNHGHPIMAEVVKAIWDEDIAAYPHDRIISKIVVTHQDEFFRGFEFATYKEVEGEFETGEAYAAWALDFAIHHEINTIFPGRHAEEMIAITDQFKAKGITLLHTASVKESAVMNDRPAMYRRLQECFHGDIVPDFLIWQDDYKLSLEETVRRVRAPSLSHPDAHRSVCVAPAVGKINKGFFQFVETRDPEQQLEHPEMRVMKIGDFGQIAHSLALLNQSTRKWVIMEYMPKVIYSVDCLAWNGQIVAHVIREKQGEPGQGHIVTENDFLQRQVEILAKDFGLSGIFSAKFLVDSQGRLKFLSASPRFFGGLGMSILAGLNLPWLWLKMHQSQGIWASRIPKPLIGTRLDSVLCSVRLGSSTDAPATAP
jgi:hypothetical protein